MNSRYNIHQLRIKDSQKEFYQEGLCALWNVCETYQPEKCPLDSYLNYTIRNRLIDSLRKKKREEYHDEIFLKEESNMQGSGNRWLIFALFNYKRKGWLFWHNRENLREVFH